MTAQAAIDGEIAEQVAICNKRGLHARAAAKFVKTLTPFAADVFVSKGDVRVSGRSIMGLMMLAAPEGTLVTICASGPDAVPALAALVDLMKRKSDED